MYNKSNNSIVQPHNSREQPEKHSFVRHTHKSNAHIAQLKYIVANVLMFTMSNLLWPTDAGITHSPGEIARIRNFTALCIEYIALSINHEYSRENSIKIQHTFKSILFLTLKSQNLNYASFS